MATNNTNHYMYVLSCSDNSLYTGYTTNLSKRLKTHNQGRGAKYTKHRHPVHLLYYELFDSKSEAMKAEYAFKQKNRSDKLSYIKKHFFKLSKASH